MRAERRQDFGIHHLFELKEDFMPSLRVLNDGIVEDIAGSS